MGRTRTRTPSYTAWQHGSGGGVHLWSGLRLEGGGVTSARGLVPISTPIIVHAANTQVHVENTLWRDEDEVSRFSAGGLLPPPVPFKRTANGGLHYSLWHIFKSCYRPEDDYSRRRALRHT